MNRTVAAYLQAIVAAEQVLRWVPPGTHDWERFLSPEEIGTLLRAVSPAFSVVETSGLVYDPLRTVWSLADNTTVNYILCARHQA